jgi:hypothetical protein
MERTSPTVAAAVVHFVTGALVALSLVAVFGFSRMLRDVTDFGRVALVTGTLLLVWIPFVLFTGRALLQRRRWARATIVVIYALIVAAMLVRIGEVIDTGSLVAPFALVLPLLVIGLLLHPESRQEFTAGAAREPAA